MPKHQDANYSYTKCMSQKHIHTEEGLISQPNCSFAKFEWANVRQQYGVICFMSIIQYLTLERTGVKQAITQPFFTGLTFVGNIYTYTVTVGFRLQFAQRLRKTHT